MAASPGHLVREDHEYRRARTRNLLVAIEPKGGRRAATVTRRRTKPDFVGFVQSLIRGSFEEVLGVEVARQFMARIEFHYTPKHACWLNMAEIEIGILDRQCLGRRIGNEHYLKAKVEA